MWIPECANGGFYFICLPEESLQQLSQQAMVDVEGRMGNLANGSQQTFLATKAVHGCRLLEHLVQTPPAPARWSGSRVIHTRLGEIRGIAR